MIQLSDISMIIRYLTKVDREELTTEGTPVPDSWGYGLKLTGIGR